MEHSPTSATGTGWERTPWHATQKAAWEALERAPYSAAATRCLGNVGARLTSTEGGR
jgi:hypothetical protein